jgi:hypothetical protein
LIAGLLLRASPAIKRSTTMEAFPPSFVTIHYQSSPQYISTLFL